MNKRNCFLRSVIVVQSFFLFFFLPQLSAQVKKKKIEETDMDSLTRVNDSISKYNIDYWGSISPGKGFLVANTKFGTLNISGYMLFRYINQTPATQTYHDHLGNQLTTDGRQDIIWHRVQAFFTGWV